MVAGTSITAAVAPSTPPGAYQIRVIALSPTGQVIGPFSDAISLIVE